MTFQNKNNEGRQADGGHRWIPSAWDALSKGQFFHGMIFLILRKPVENHVGVEMVTSYKYFESNLFPASDSTKFMYSGQSI